MKNFKEIVKNYVYIYLFLIFVILPSLIYIYISEIGIPPNQATQVLEGLVLYASVPIPIVSVIILVIFSFFSFFLKIKILPIHIALVTTFIGGVLWFESTNNSNDVWLTLSSFTAFVITAGYLLLQKLLKRK